MWMNTMLDTKKNLDDVFECKTTKQVCRPQEKQNVKLSTIYDERFQKIFHMRNSSIDINVNTTQRSSVNIYTHI